MVQLGANVVHLVVVATQHHANNVLPDVMDVTLHGGLKSASFIDDHECINKVYAIV